MSLGYQRRPRYAVTVPTRQLLASAMTLIAMWTFYLLSHGLAGMGDWVGYRVMYDTGGDYLVKQGRDPLFVGMISGAAAIFGYEGYETFRDVTFSIFTLVAARWAYLARGLTPVTALTISAALIIKSVVQLREGIAFLILAWPLMGLYVHRPATFTVRPRSAFAALVGAVVGALIHVGTAIYLGIWFGAAFLAFIPRKFLEWRYTPRALLLLGIGSGFALGSTIIIFPEPFKSVLIELAGAAYATPQLFALKVVYWLTLGILTFATGGQVLNAAKGCSPFGYAYAVVLGRFVLPLIFCASVVLVLTSFATVEITEWGNRLLVSLLQLSIILITIRGRANYLTLAISIILLANEARSFLPFWGLDPPV
jgi:hypothetical protein